MLCKQSMKALAGGAAVLMLLSAETTAVPALAASSFAGMAVSVVTPQRECFKNLLPVSGVLVPVTEIAVRPDRDGLIVSEVLVQPGDIVTAGQALARLTAPPGAPSATATTSAPVAGTLIAVTATVGSTTSASAGAPMFRIMKDGELRMKGEILASAMPRLKIGQAASLDIMGLQRLSGRVAAIEPSIDAVTQLGIVRISLDADPRLRPGAFARAQVDAGTECDVGLPLSAILYGSDGPYVQIVADGRVARRPVSVGIASPAGDVEIRDGLQPLDVVIARAGGFLREGDRVNPVSDRTP